MICNAIYIIKHTDEWHEEVDLVNGVTEELKIADSYRLEGTLGAAPADGHQWPPEDCQFVKGVFSI